MRWAVLIVTLIFVVCVGVLVRSLIVRWARFGAARTTTAPAGRFDVASGDGLRVHGPLPGDDADWPRLEFAIKNVRRDQKMTAQPPYHHDGGRWTVFDGHVVAGAPPPPSSASSSPAAVFTVAVETPTPVKDAGDVPVAFSNVMLLPPADGNGDRLVVALAKAFRHDPPAPRATRTPLVPVTFRTAHLGDGLAAHPAGGYGGAGGNWTATKWFANAAGYEAEVFFNYNLVDGVGEFAEKDTDYREDLLNVMALVLRDGPRPPRTPANDPNLAAIGPQVADLRPIPNSDDAQFVFSPGGKRLVVHKFEPGRSVAFMIDPAKPADQTPVAQLQGWMSDVICFDADVTRVVAAEQMVKDLKSFSGNAPRRIWIIDRASGQQTRVQGPWGEGGTLFADQRPLSPDGRFLVIQSLAPAPAPAPAPTTAAVDSAAPRPRARRQQVWHVYNVGTATAVNLKLPVTSDGDDDDDHVEMVGWTGNGASLRAVMKVGDPFDDARPRRIFLIDPATGAAARSSVQPASVDALLSSDGRLRMSLTPGKQLDVLDVASGRLRTFTFHEDDRRFADDPSVFEWLGPRYIRFDTQRPGFIDTRTMKLSYLPRAASPSTTPSTPAGGDAAADDEEDGPHFGYSPDFKWGVTRGDDDALLVGRVVVPD